MSQWRAKALELLPELRHEIESSDSVGGLWIELIVYFRHQYRDDAEPAESHKQIRAICLYAIWCDRSDSSAAQEAAAIEFYGYLPRVALECGEVIYMCIVRDLITNLGMREVEKMGAVLKPSERSKFVADARAVEQDLQKRSRKR